MRTIALALATLLYGCDSATNTNEAWSYHCTEDSVVCWHQNDNDTRNTAASDPRNCTYTTTDSTWIETCISGDTARMKIAYSEGYYEQRGSDKKGIYLFVIVGNDTTITEIE